MTKKHGGRLEQLNMGWEYSGLVGEAEKVRTCRFETVRWLLCLLQRPFATSSGVAVPAVVPRQKTEDYKVR
ncbi:hypothetical protein SESBI_17425 [Sesbania bispinosa]|nr:hypothetical protein SESBI_17425 [Sesbania bispinosa]